MRNRPEDCSDETINMLWEGGPVLPTVIPRYRLLRDVLECDLQAGAIGVVVRERVGDEMQYVLTFDARPGLRVTFYEPEFDARSPEYKLEAL